MNSETGGILGIFGFLVSMGGVIYAAINHKKVRCRCCGKNLDMSVDVDSTEEKAKEEKPKEEEKEEEEQEEEVTGKRRASIHADEGAGIRVTGKRRASIQNDEEIEVERKQYRKTRIVPLPEEP